MVCHPPTRAPSSFNAGQPPHTAAMSVVVPPMSMTKASWTSHRWSPPMTLAAGPDRVVSTGRSRATSASISDPSPLTTIRGAWIPCVVRNWRIWRINWCIKGISRALRATVSALSGASSRVVSSWPQVTGTSVKRRTSCFTRSSCLGLRTPKNPETAKAVTHGA